MAEQGGWKKFTDDEGFTFEAWLGSGPAPEKEWEYGEGQNTEEIQKLIKHLKETATDGREPTQADFDRYFAQEGDNADVYRESLGLEERNIPEAIQDDLERSQLNKEEQRQKIEMQIRNLERERRDNQSAARQEAYDAPTPAANDPAPAPDTAPTPDFAPAPESSGSNKDINDEIVAHLSAIEETLKLQHDVLMEMNSRFEEEGLKITL